MMLLRRGTNEVPEAGEQEEDDEEENENDSMVNPPDGGWGWVMVAGGI